MTEAPVAVPRVMWRWRRRPQWASGPEQASLPFAAAAALGLGSRRRDRLAASGCAGFGDRPDMPILELDVEPHAGHDRAGGTQWLALRPAHQRKSARQNA